MLSKRVLVLLLGGLLAQSAAAQSSSPVSVVNTPGVTVENVPAVTVQNTPSVTLLNVPGVFVTNDQELPVYVNVVDSVDTEPQSLIEYRIVGYTRTTTTGRIEADGGLLVGIAAMHRLCSDEVASNARAAFTSEAFLPAPPIVEPNARLAWVLPALSLPTYGDPVEIANATCGWHEQTTSAAGLAVAPLAGRVARASCEAVLPIACSAPIAIAVSAR